MSDKNFAILSTGNPDEDQKVLNRFARGDELIRRGMCPNGCGGMITVDGYNAECPKCNFGYFASGGLSFTTDGKVQ